MKTENLHPFSLENYDQISQDIRNYYDLFNLPTKTNYPVVCFPENFLLYSHWGNHTADVFK